MAHSFPPRRPSVLAVAVLAADDPQRRVGWHGGGGVDGACLETARYRPVRNGARGVAGGAGDRRGEPARSGAVAADAHGVRQGAGGAGAGAVGHARSAARSEEHTSELQSLMRNSYAVFCLKKKKNSMETDTR